MLRYRSPAGVSRFIGSFIVVVVRFAAVSGAVRQLRHGLGERRGRPVRDCQLVREGWMLATPKLAGGPGYGLGIDRQRIGPAARRTVLGDYHRCSRGLDLLNSHRTYGALQ